MLKLNIAKCMLTRISGIQLVAANIQQRAGYRHSDTPEPDRDLLKRRLFYKGDKPPKRPAIRPFSRCNKIMEKNHPEREKFPNQYTDPFPKGKVYNKLPIKIPLEAGKMYSWCTCGHSHKQPFCDGAHKRLDGTAFKKTRPMFRPHRFSVEETKDYYLCNCKQTDNRPFCDGSHKPLSIKSELEAIQSEVDTEQAELDEELAAAEEEGLAPADEKTPPKN